MDYNNGLGFTCNNVNPLNQKIFVEKDGDIPFNDNFMTTNKNEQDDEMPF
jgi:hypothetical protein